MTWLSRNPIKIAVILILVLFLVAPFASASASAPGQTEPVHSFVLTPEILAAIAGAVLSLIFSYVPGLSSRFAALPDETKRAIMAGLLLITAAGIFGLSCANILAIGIACTQSGLFQVIWIYIIAITANQSVHRISPKTPAVKRAAQ